ncbi:MAG: hypothetical protein ACQET8_06210 [Bacillota bacterium]
MKMSLLGIAFLLALGGLFILDTLSLGLALAAITAISFLAAYLADKRVNFVAAAGQTEIVLSFSEEEAAATQKADEHLNEIKLDTIDDQPDSNVSVNEDIVESEELVVNDEILVVDSIIEDNDSQIPEEIESIELLDLEIIEDISKDESILENINPVLELTEDDQLTELQDDEFNFLTETREISEEEVTKLPEPTDIKTEEIILQRAALLEELDEIEVVEDLLHEIPSIEEENFTEEELFYDKDFMIQENDLLENAITEELLEVDVENLITIPEETNTEEAHIMEEPIIEVEITPEEPIQVESEIETPLEEVVEKVESVEENPSFLEQDVIHVLDTEEEVAEIEEVEAPITESVEISTPDMNVELQDMFLSTLHSYEESDDHSSYQEMLVTLVNQKLSDKDFYLFSKLLLNSYVTSSDLSNVNPLIEKMEEKLSYYPVIVEELQRYKEMNK